MGTTENTQAIADHMEREDEISLLDLGIVLAKRKKLVLGFPLAVAILATALALALPNVYTATTKILPPQQGQSAASAMLAQLGGLAGLAGVASGLKNPADLYVGMLNSRTVADNLIKRFDLNAVYEQDYQSKTRERLDDKTTITAGKDGIISIDVDDEDAKRAADMANAYVDELFALTKTLAVTEAAQRRLFFEKQLEQARDNLVKVETSARAAISEGGLVKVDTQGRALVETTARLRAQVAVKEVEIGAMRSFATSQNPQLLAVQQEVAALKHELARMEGTGDAASADKPPTTQGMKNLGLLRDVKYYESVYELLAQQLEMARIDEAKDPALVQVVDKAIVPDRQSWRKRILIILLSTLVAGVAAVLWVFIKESLEMERRNPQNAERLDTFRRYLSWRKR
ncbi:Lipopolysaccharide biosynthesis protein [Georgfuchsia toluolica]|uniref:Lipopolysaccharide biosynthesis protein n=1 Tax=Georgfuchsia toluolica TaxID=424218 RepID=A0A916J5K2_9PROT|nr:Wzz/FepE/Etk N-terminal domain-containing protein [Georgfuchsia toluolica]CAG4884357.1 Lipopolysaccharide biosynthesis protein [Georgfuchsia toluolica]